MKKWSQLFWKSLACFILKENIIILANFNKLFNFEQTFWTVFNK